MKQVTIPHVWRYKKKEELGSKVILAIVAWSLLLLILVEIFVK